MNALRMDHDQERNTGRECFLARIRLGERPTAGSRTSLYRYAQGVALPTVSLLQLFPLPSPHGGKIGLYEPAAAWT